MTAERFLHWALNVATAAAAGGAAWTASVGAWDLFAYDMALVGLGVWSYLRRDPNEV